MLCYNSTSSTDKRLKSEIFLTPTVSKPTIEEKTFNSRPPILCLLDLIKNIFKIMLKYYIYFVIFVIELGSEDFFPPDISVCPSVWRGNIILTQQNVRKKKAWRLSQLTILHCNQIFWQVWQNLYFFLHRCTSVSFRPHAYLRSIVRKSIFRQRRNV